MTPVDRRRRAIPAIGPAVVRVGIRTATGPAVQRVLELIADAMRPGVIRTQRDATADPALSRQEQALIIRRAAVIDRVYKREILPDLWIR